MKKFTGVLLAISLLLGQSSVVMAKSPLSEHDRQILSNITGRTVGAPAAETPIENSSISDMVKPVEEHLSQYWPAYTAVILAASIYATIKSYETGKIKAAKKFLPESNPLRDKLAHLEAQLDNPNLSKSDRSSLESDRDKLISEMVSIYFQDKSFVKTFLAAFKSVLLA